MKFWYWYYGIVAPLWLLLLVLHFTVFGPLFFDKWPYWTNLSIDSILFASMIMPPFVFGQQAANRT